MAKVGIVMGSDSDHEGDEQGCRYAGEIRD